MIIWNGKSLVVPPSMGQARADQLCGTDLENLGEIACRICYDSLGTGRSSAELHKHILDVINLSVYEHCNFTVSFDREDVYYVVWACVNRKGVWVQLGVDSIDITINFRALLEWERHTKNVNSVPSEFGNVSDIIY